MCSSTPAYLFDADTTNLKFDCTKRFTALSPTRTSFSCWGVNCFPSSWSASIRCTFRPKSISCSGVSKGTVPMLFK